MSVRTVWFVTARRDDGATVFWNEQECKWIALQGTGTQYTSPARALRAKGRLARANPSLSLRIKQVDFT